MIPVTAYRGKKIGVFGLARTGLSVVRALKAGGADVYAFDDNGERVDAAVAEGAKTLDFAVADIKDFAAIVASPGVPLTHPAPHPVVANARSFDVQVIGDIELFVQSRSSLPRSTVVAITGTNGKSTTTALVGHMLKECGRAAEIGGNIGQPVLALDPLPEGGVYVFEMSSYQIDLTAHMVPDVAVLLNITPDHLDRHGDMSGYVAAKARLFGGQKAGQVAVVGLDSTESRKVAATIEARRNGPKLVPVSAGNDAGRGISVIDGVLYDGLSGMAVPVGSLGHAPALVGQHNAQNAAAAYAVGRALGLTPEKIFMALTTFPGLAHRMERVGELAGVLFINDSKATNVDAASRALASYDNIYWIAGGKPKTADLNDLAPCFGNIRKTFLIGEAAGAFARSLGGKVQTEQCGDLSHAVTAAAEAALQDKARPAVVLLSPACASFDQFRDFEERGARFAELVNAFIADHQLAADEARMTAGGNGK